MRTDADADRMGTLADGGEGVGGRAALLDSISERCARALLRAQADSRLGATPSAEPAEAAAGEDEGEGGSGGESVLPAADWLLSSAAAAVVTPERGGSMAAAAAPPKVADLRACFRAAGCAVGEAALDALSAGRAPPALPQREACLICDAPVGVSLEGGDVQRCAAGHELQRCWVCLRLLPLRASLCTCCGAGCCEEHGASPAAGILCRVSPPGVCGLCGSPCNAPLPGVSWP